MLAHECGCLLSRVVEQQLGDARMFPAALQPISARQRLAVFHKAPNLVHLCKTIDKKWILRTVEDDLMESAAAVEDLDGGKGRSCTFEKRDLFRMADSFIALPDDQAALRAEHAIRNYDPCISCATHFLKLKVEGR